MNVRRLLASAFVLITASFLIAQSAPVVPINGLELLQRVSKNYADAKSYHIEVVEENTSSAELRHAWDKTLLNAAEDVGGRFHYEGRGGFGGAMQISDGASVWQYRPNDHTYTKSSLASYDPNTAIYTPAEMPVLNARGTRKLLAGLSSHYKSATLLPDANIEVNGHTISCYVIRLTPADEKRSTGQSLEQTIWIDRVKEVFVKRESRGQTFMFAGAGRVPEDMQTTTTYPVTELDVPLPATLFSFTPPPDAELVETFPNPMQTGGGPSLQGQMVPDLKFTSQDGKAFSTTSLRGKVVVLDLWATWCAPCVKALEQIALLNKQGRDKGLVLITIDQDEEAETATALLKKKGYDWTNVHDGGEIIKVLGGTGGIPRTILVNQEGKVLYDRVSVMDTDLRELRKAIAGLGPEFASLAPTPAASPCGTQAAAVTAK